MFSTRHVVLTALFASFTSIGNAQQCPFGEPASNSCGAPTLIPGTPGQHVVFVDASAATAATSICGEPVEHTVWFEVTPTVSGPLRFTSCHPMTTYDTVIRAFSGGNSECQGWVEEDCEDDSAVPECDNGCSFYGGEIVFNATAGVRYRFEVGAHSSNPADCALCLGVIVTIGNPCGAPPVNLACSLAHEIPGTAGTHDVELDVADAFLLPTERTPTCVAGVGHTVWFRTTPQVDGRLTFTTCRPETNYDTVVQVYTGECSGFLSPGVCSDDVNVPACDTGCQSPNRRGSDVTIDVSANNTYYFQVGSFADNIAGCDLCLGARVTLTEVECTTNAQCDDGLDCTENVCSNGSCTYPNKTDGAPCGSGANTACDRADSCQNGVCLANQVTVGTPCPDDGNECTTDACDGLGACTHTARGDGQPCPDDGNACTDDVCNGGLCTHPNRPNGSACGSGTSTDCDRPDSCRNGACQANLVPQGTPCPDDGNDCTNDVCSGGLCDHPDKLRGTPCGSGSNTVCDNPDFCEAGSCLPNLEPVGRPCPDDGNACTDDFCNGFGDCTHPLAVPGTPCSNGLFCDGGETCNGQGSCQPGNVPCEPDEVCIEALDRCAADCNRNGTPDEVDIANETSADDNRNGIPDDCDVSHPVKNCTPAAWQADNPTWIRDTQPANKVDDLIDASSDDVFDVIVNFKTCVGGEEIELLRALGPQGEIQRRLKYVSSVAVGHLPKGSIFEIAALPQIVFIERQVGFAMSLDVSVQNLCVTTGTCSPNTVEQRFPNVDGRGINMVIMDSGVDNAVHNAFTTGQYVAGYDATATPPVFVDPDDDFGHGTHVASIALGHATTNTSRGVAPGAGLIDVRVFTAATRCNTPGMWLRVVDALETVYDRRDTWGVDVINMSFGQCNAAGGVASDGRDSFSQLVDLAESMGIVVVAAAGNAGPSNTFLTSPAAATRAITVAASNDLNTGARGDDVIEGFSSRGPRNNDGDSDNLDELKPDVAAPGGHGATSCSGFDAANGIRAARFNTTNNRLRMCGTSMAAPHVAGVAALIMNARPGINAASVKELIISTATARGTPSNPAVDPIWNNRWGWGLIDAFAALNVATTNDLTFPSHPPPIGWLSPDITTIPFPPKRGQPVTLTAQIRNTGTTTATDARIHFGVHVFSASTPTFHDIGTRVVDIPANPTSSTPVSIQWTPRQADHQCLKVEIAYGPDTDYSNNKAQRNIRVANSPVSFKVKNSVTEAPALIEMVPTLEDPNSGWTFSIVPPTLVLAADDCAANVEAELFPPNDARPGARQTLHIAAVARIPSGQVEVGGVSILQVVPCGADSDCDDDDPCSVDECNDQGTCVNTPILHCRRCTTHGECEDGNECTDNLCSDGVCAFPNTPGGSPCGNAGDVECDHPDTCDGAGTCAPNYSPRGTPCGDQPVPPCDLADTCDGAGRCHDNVAGKGTPCPDGVFCNGEEACDGAGGCLLGTDPCRPNEPCNEEEAVCVGDTDFRVCHDPAFDENGDGFVDWDDFGLFPDCLAGPGAPFPTVVNACQCFDHNENGHVDLEDTAAWQRCFSGMNSPADVDCDGPFPEGLRPDQKANLVASALTTDPAYPVPGEGVDVRVTVRNLSREDVQSVAVAFSWNGAEVASQRTDVAAESATVLHFPWVPDTAGTHTLGAVVDPDAELIDRDRIDNMISADVLVASPPPGGADFAIVKLVVLELPDRPVVPCVTIRNNGSAAGRAPLVVQGDGRVIDQRLLDLIEPDDSVIVKIPWPAGVVPGRITGEVNPRFRVLEDDPGDNVLVWDFTPVVDLYVHALTVHALAVELGRQQQATVSFRVTNGAGQALVTPFTTTIDLGAVGTYDVVTPGLNAGETVYISRTVFVQSIEPGFTGEFDIRVEADSGHVVAESDEVNNVAYSHFTQSPPDIGHWVAIGPRRLTSGVGAVGRFHEIAMTPTTSEPGSPLTIYLGAPSGSGGQKGGSGIWKSTNTGATWEPVGDSLPTLSIRGLAVDPSVTSRVYAITAEAGVFQSEDGGTSWRRISTVNTGASGGGGGAFLVDPTDSNRLFLVSSGGIRRSDDRGVTWPVVLDRGNATGLEMDRSDPARLYAGIRNDDNLSRTGIYVSVDSGTTWRQLTGCPGHALPTVTGPTTISIARSGNRLYASYKTATSWTLYYTTDIGCSIGGRQESVWEKGWSAPGCTQPCTPVYSTLWSGLHADPFNPNYVYANGTDFYVSTDGGKTFSYSPGPHADHHGFAIDPWDPANIYTTSDGGIYRSNNRGASNSWSFVGEGITNVEFYDIAGARTESGRIIGGTQDNGTVRYDGSSTLWAHIRGGDGGTVDIDPTNEQTLYSMNQYADSIGRSTNGDPFVGFAENLPTKGQCFNLHFQVHPTDTTTLLASCTSLWRTTTSTPPGNWQILFTPPTGNGGVQRTAVDRTVDLYYAGTSNGRLYAGPGGANFQRVFTHPGNRGVTDIEIDLDQPTTVYASFGGTGGARVYRFTRDSAAPTTMDDAVMDASLPTGIAVRTIAVDRNAPDTIYAGTTKGVYRGRSVDGGLTWTWSLYNEGMPPAVDVKDIEVHPTTGVMRAATLGRGAFEVNTSRPLGSVLAAEGRLTLLRVHDVGTGFGPPGDTIDGEVIVRLDTHPRKAFGFALRTGAAGHAHRAMTNALRTAFQGNNRVRIDYVRTGINNGRIVRVMDLP